MPQYAGSMAFPPAMRRFASTSSNFVNQPTNQYVVELELDCFHQKLLSCSSCEASTITN